MVQGFRIVAAAFVLAATVNVSADEPPQPVPEKIQPQPVPNEIAVGDAGTATVDVPPADGFSEFSAAVGGIAGEQLYPYDAPEPWMHGYFQEIPAYGGYFSFRPYNYKHVLAQSQAAGGWGMSPRMSYSQQFWHRYQKKASMLPEQSRRSSGDEHVGLVKLRDGGKFTGRHRSPATPAVPGRLNPVPITPPLRVIEPVGYPPVSRLEAIRYRMQQQARQMQALQQAYRHEYQTEAARRPVAVPLER